MKANPPEQPTRPAASPEIRKGIARFLEHLRGERHASVHTLRAYQNELGRFAEYLGPEIRWKDIDHVFLRGFLSSLHSQGLSKVSVARALAALRSMYKWLARVNHVEGSQNMSWWEPLYKYEELESKWSDSVTKWIEFIETKTDADLHEYVRFIGFDGGEWEARYEDIALQLNYHSIHHRAQMQKIIRKQGLEPDFLDYIGTVYRKIS